MQGAVIQTEANWSKKFVQINKLAVAGTITDTKIAAVGNIGSVTAAALDGSFIYAGVATDVIQNNALPADDTQLSQTGAYLRSVALGKAGKFSGSIIAAGIVDSLQLGTVTTSNGGTPQGVAGHVMDLLEAILDTGAVLDLTKIQLKTQAAVNAYLQAKGATLNDFALVVLS
jgi:hypothetical protein